jgi:hypothetical protein
VGMTRHDPMAARIDGKGDVGHFFAIVPRTGQQERARAPGNRIVADIIAMGMARDDQIDLRIEPVENRANVSGQAFAPVGIVPRGGAP